MKWGFLNEEEWKEKHFDKLDEIFRNGGYIYRIIYSKVKLKSFEKLKEGYHWTYSKDMIYKQINLSMSQVFFDDNGDLEFCYAYLVSAFIKSKGFDLEFSKEKALELELEVYLEEDNYDSISEKVVEEFRVRNNEFTLNQDKFYSLIPICMNL